MFSRNSKPSTRLWSSYSYMEKSKNSLINLYARDFGIISPLTLIRSTNNYILDEIKLSKSRCVQSSRFSINWLDLDKVENKFLLAGKSDGNVICIDMFQEQCKEKKLKILFNSSNSRQSHKHSVSCVQWYPIDSGMFFTSSMDQKFKVWDTNNLIVVDEYCLNHKIYNHEMSATLSTNSKNLIALALDNGQIRFIDLNSGSFTHTLKAHHQALCVCVRWSPNNSNLLCSAGSDGRIGLWDIRSSKSCLMYFDYEKTKGGKQNSKSSYNTASITTKCLAHTDPIISLAYTKDGNHIISLGKDNALRLWDSSDGLNTLVNYGKIQLDKAVAESCLQMTCTEFCNPSYVYVPSGNNLLMFNILDGELKSTYKGHFESINCCYYNSSLNEFYTGSKDRNILIWSYEKEVLNDESKSSSSLPIRNSYSILSNTGRNNSTNNNLNTVSTINSNGRLNDYIVRTAAKRPLDNWSDDDDN